MTGKSKACLSGFKRSLDTKLSYFIIISTYVLVICTNDLEKENIQKVKPSLNEYRLVY